MRRRVLGPHVQEHLAVAERVELGLALGARRVRRDRLEDAVLVLEQHVRVVRRTVGALRGRSGLAGARRRLGRHPGPQARVWRRTPGRGVGRALGPLHVADTAARRSGGVVRQVEVLAQREARVVRRHVDPPQVAIALEDDPEHVVGLALHPLGALPQEGRRRHARVVARQAVGDHAQPVRRRGAPEVVDDLHLLAGVDAGEVGEHREGEVRLVMQAAQDVDDVARADPDLGLVVALPGRAVQDALESRLQPARKGSIHRLRPRPGRSGRSRAPASGRGDP